MISYVWRGHFTNDEVNALHAEGFGHEPLDIDWQAQLQRHSLGWVCARDALDEISVSLYGEVPLNREEYLMHLAGRSTRRG